jgi:hypothetical protein
MTNDKDDPEEFENRRRKALAKVYALILSWPDPEKKLPDYCTQNDGECATCPLAKGELDCEGNKYAAT